MTKFIRYAIAAIFFAASVGCLALWWRSMSAWDVLEVRSPSSPNRVWNLQSFTGYTTFSLLTESGTLQRDFQLHERWRHTVNDDVSIRRENFDHIKEAFGAFHLQQGLGHFPHWFPALAFFLGGFGVLKIQRYSIRSTLVATTVVAVLLGIAMAW